MKTIKITEKAHENLRLTQFNYFKITKRWLTFSEIIEKYVIKDLSEDDQSKK